MKLTYTTKTFKPNHIHEEWWVSFDSITTDARMIRTLQTMCGKGNSEQAALEDLMSKAGKIVGGLN